MFVRMLWFLYRLTRLPATQFFAELSNPRGYSFPHECNLLYHKTIENTRGFYKNVRFHIILLFYICQTAECLCGFNKCFPSIKPSKILDKIYYIRSSSFRGAANFIIRSLSYDKTRRKHLQAQRQPMGRSLYKRLRL